VKISVIMPNFNGERFLDGAIRSVTAQRDGRAEVELIVVDGGSTDGSAAILRRHASEIDGLIREPDRGPADAINKGIARSTGEVIAWLNADDLYTPGALARVSATMDRQGRHSLCFGRCSIIGEDGREIRRGITRFKECFFPLSSRFAIQCINYISQPAMFFYRRAFDAAGPLRLDLTAAWDYDLILRLWEQGEAIRIPGPPLAAFRSHAGSISIRHFRTQFAEEWDVAARHAGRWSPQAALHLGVRWGIVGIYTLMAWRRRRQNARRN
jgi:glycosyltransferase involved in cell wall biosynthesis